MIMNDYEDELRNAQEEAAQKKVKKLKHEEEFAEEDRNTADFIKQRLRSLLRKLVKISEEVADPAGFKVARKELQIYTDRTFISIYDPNRPRGENEQYSVRGRRGSFEQITRIYVERSRKKEVTRIYMWRSRRRARRSHNRSSDIHLVKMRISISGRGRKKESLGSQALCRMTDEAILKVVQKNLQELVIEYVRHKS
jgi:hypothetical protein